MNFKAVSLFASAGVAETYFEKHGIEVKVASELLKERADLYNKLYPSVNMIQGDITNESIYKKVISLSKKAGCNFLLATPPCQGMSTAGLMKEDDPRNRLILVVIDAIKALKPQFAIIENVPEILTTKIEYKGEWRLIDDILHTELGSNYYFNERKVVNAMNYGVAQSRQVGIPYTFEEDYYHARCNRRLTFT